MKKTKGEKIFSVFNGLFMIFLAFITIYPLWYVASNAFSSAAYTNAGEVWFYPKGFTMAAFEKIAEKDGLWFSYFNSFFYMIVGTVVSMALTCLGAYPLSRTKLPGKKFFNLVVVFSMWFGAGMIPAYLNFKDLGLLDSRWGIIISSALSTYNFIVLRTGFASIPESLEEAAKIDGASDFKTMVRIFLPLAIPSLATVALFYAVGRWNSYFWEMLMLKDTSKLPLQVLLKNMVVDMSGRMDSLEYGMQDSMYSEDTFIYATMLMSIIPMLILYPFIQKYFIKGMMIGAVKG